MLMRDLLGVHADARLVACLAYRNFPDVVTTARGGLSLQWRGLPRHWEPSFLHWKGLRRVLDKVLKVTIVVEIFTGGGLSLHNSANGLSMHISLDNSHKFLEMFTEGALSLHNPATVLITANYTREFTCFGKNCTTGACALWL
jgi:hypothetical protein